MNKNLILSVATSILGVSVTPFAQAGSVVALHASAASFQANAQSILENVAQPLITQEIEKKCSSQGIAQNLNVHIVTKELPNGGVETTIDGTVECSMK